MNFTVDKIKELLGTSVVLELEKESVFFVFTNAEIANIVTIDGENHEIAKVEKEDVKTYDLNKIVYRLDQKDIIRVKKYLYKLEK